MRQSHQTINLSRGKHQSPVEGACVMELASMLAGEPFSDRPNSVCPVVGSVLRSYNDSVDNTARQELYRYASRVVGSRSSAKIEEARSERLMDWTRGLQRRRWSRFVLRWRLWPMAVPQQADVVAAIGVHSLLRQPDHDHTEILTLVDELLGMTAAAPERTGDATPRSPSSDRGEETDRVPGEAVGTGLTYGRPPGRR